VKRKEREEDEEMDEAPEVDQEEETTPLPAGGTKYEPVALPEKRKDAAVARPEVEKEPDSYFLEPIVKVPPAKNPRPPPKGAWVQTTEEILGPDSQHSYVQKWKTMTELEQSGKVVFKVVTNDGTRTNLVHLLGLKNVFVKQLPNMPKVYVARLVFDRKHESVALLNRNSTTKELQVMGGCCYRPFPTQKFGEIAFLAISHVQQVQGFGTRLMAQTKERAKALGLTHLLTCADNAAVPYFKKQGFSKRITLANELWQGYIKDYEGVTLMECKLHAKVDYLNVPLMLKAQKMCLAEKMKEVSSSHIVFPGIDVKSKKGIRIEEIPGLKEIGITNLRGLGTRGGSATIAERDPAAQKALHSHLQSVLTQIKQHQSAGPFLEPVDTQATGAVDYYEVIKNPIDLRTIQERLDLGWYYVTREIFLADLKRMVANAYQYNGKGHFVTDMAQSLEKFFSQKV